MRPHDRPHNPPHGADGRPRVYGLRGFDHAGGVLLTLMSAEGAAALAARIAPLSGADLRLTHEHGRLPVCHEIRDGAFAGLVDAFGIELLDFPTWSATKRRLGDIVYR